MTTGKERLIKRQIEFNTSNNLSLALEALAFKEKAITPRDLINAIASNPRSEGGRALQSLIVKPIINDLSIESNSSGSITIKLKNGKVVTGDTRVNEIIRTAMAMVGETKPMKTGDIILAESSLEHSIIRSNLKVDLHPQHILSVIQVLRSTNEYQEKYPETGSIKHMAESVVDENNLPTLDLLQAAKSGDIKYHSAKRVWIRSILTSLESSAAVTAIDSDSSQEVVSIMEGLALSLASDAKGTFSYKSIICINPLQLENNPEIAIRDAINLAKNGILYLPNLKEYLNLKSVRSAIASRSTKIITTTSTPNPAEFRKIDSILNSANHVHLEAMSANEAFDILVKTKPELEKRLGNGLHVTITDAALKRAAEQALMYQTALNLPTIQGAEALIARATTLIKFVMADLQELDQVSIKSDLQIDPEDILIALRDLTGIESFTDNPERYLNMEEELSKRVAGQDEAIRIVSDKIRSAKAGIKDPKKPIGNFAFFGPSGVGKSELAKALAEFLFGSENALIQIDMSGLNSEASINTLKGSQSGYVNSDDGGSLTEAVAKRPYSVICLDEFEKAHPKVQDMFHGILEDGKTQNGKGKDVDFRNTIIIITSNAGSELYYDQESVGKEETKRRVLEAVKEKFRPDFLNRFDGIIAFNTLDLKVVQTIIDIIIKGKNKLLSQSAGITLELTPEAKDSFCNRGFSPAWGARPLKRLIENEIISPLSKLILGRKISPGDTALVTLENDKIVLRKK